VLSSAIQCYPELRGVYIMRKNTVSYLISTQLVLNNTPNH